MNNRMKNHFKEKENLKFFILLGIVAIACIFKFFDHGMVDVNTTPFAFSYKYGFVSRGLLGTSLQFLDQILPGDMVSYHTVYMLSEAVTALLFLVLFAFFAICLKHSGEGSRKNMQVLILLMGMITFPMYLTIENFGRLDVYLLMISVLCCILLIAERLEWLLIPLSVLAMLLHHGYVFTNLNIVLVVMIYKLLTNREKRRKYAILLTLTFVISSVLFLYFEFWGHVDNVGVYDEIVTLAKTLSQSGTTYHDHLVNHEVLGQGVFMDEIPWHVVNYIEFPFFLLLCWPYLYLIGNFLRKLISRQGDIQRKRAYIVMTLGVLTILPEMILKTDYGRYVFMFFFYYLACILILMALKDELVITLVQEEIEYFKNHGIWTLFLLIYAFMFIPFRDFHIADIFEDIYDLIIIRLPIRQV